VTPAVSTSFRMHVSANNSNGQLIVVPNTGATEFNLGIQVDLTLSYSSLRSLLVYSRMMKARAEHALMTFFIVEG